MSDGDREPERAQIKQIAPVMFEDKPRAKAARRRLIASAYELGTPTKDIAKEFGCSLGMVSYTAKVMGLPKWFGGPSWNRPCAGPPRRPDCSRDGRRRGPVEAIRRELSHQFGIVFSRAAVEEKAKQLGLKIATSEQVEAGRGGSLPSRLNQGSSNKGLE